MTAIELTKDAERDLIDIFLFGIEHFGASHAERYSAAIMEKIESAAANPRVRTHNQNMTVAAMQMADRKSSPHLS